MYRIPLTCRNFFRHFYIAFIHRQHTAAIWFVKYGRDSCVRWLVLGKIENVKRITFSDRQNNYVLSPYLRVQRHSVCSSPRLAWSRSSRTWRRRCRSWSRWHRPPLPPHSPLSAAPEWRISAPSFWWSPKTHPQSISDKQFFSPTWYLRSLSLAWVTFRWKRKKKWFMLEIILHIQMGISLVIYCESEPCEN